MKKRLIIALSLAILFVFIVAGCGDLGDSCCNKDDRPCRQGLICSDSSCTCVENQDCALYGVNCPDNCTSNSDCPNERFCDEGTCVTEDCYVYGGSWCD